VPLNKTDRAVETEAWFKRLMGERSGADRLRMACDMFDLGIALIVGSLPPEIAKAGGVAADVLAGTRRAFPEDRR